MKVFLMVLLAVCLLTGNLFAQAAPVPTQGLTFGLAPGLDNAWLFSPGKTKGFWAVGAGIDVASYTKKLSKSGSTLAMYLHGMALTPATGNLKAPIFGVAANVDIIQLVKGSKLVILVPQLSLLAGPTLAYDTGSGGVLMGGNLSFNYKF